jgi:hypothetical protein
MGCVIAARVRARRAAPWTRRSSDGSSSCAACACRCAVSVRRTLLEEQHGDQSHGDFAQVREVQQGFLQAGTALDVLRAMAAPVAEAREQPHRHEQVHQHFEQQPGRRIHDGAEQGAGLPFGRDVGTAGAAQRDARYTVHSLPESAVAMAATGAPAIGCLIRVPPQSAARDTVRQK